MCVLVCSTCIRLCVRARVSKCIRKHALCFKGVHFNGDVYETQFVQRRRLFLACSEARAVNIANKYTSRCLVPQTYKHCVCGRARAYACSSVLLVANVSKTTE